MSKQRRSLISLIARAAAIVLNIAEGREGMTDADFARFLAIARGSANELAAQLAFAAVLQLIDGQPLAPVLDRLGHVGRMLSALIKPPLILAPLGHRPAQPGGPRSGPRRRGRCLASR